MKRKCHSKRNALAKAAFILDSLSWDKCSVWTLDQIHKTYSQLILQLRLLLWVGRSWPFFYWKHFSWIKIKITSVDFLKVHSAKVSSLVPHTRMSRNAMECLSNCHEKLMLSWILFIRSIFFLSIPYSEKYIKVSCIFIKFKRYYVCTFRNVLPIATPLQHLWFDLKKIYASSNMKQFFPKIILTKSNRKKVGGCKFSQELRHLYDTTGFTVYKMLTVCKM